ncbi:MAG: nucleoside hydrolase [Gammaproteobacteria bacterium]|nr:nucleoside hydrolase [Gammaproteobacteria bacterium]
MNKNHKIILDTDPGIDDAMALLYAINHPDIEILGLTTIFGNLATVDTTKNALDLLAHFGCEDIPVAKGSDQPLKKVVNSYADFVHGQNGLGNVSIGSAKKTAHQLSAAEFIVEQILRYPHEVTLVAIAPLTNLALALQLEPKIASLVKQVVIMGGAYRVNGNISPVAEANIYNDPHAADQVLNAGWPVTVLGLDVTLKVILDNDFMNPIKAISQRGEFLYNISRFYDDFYRTTSGYDGFSCHDAYALAYLTNPEYFTCSEGRVRVGTEGLCEGMTIFDDKMNYNSTNNPWHGKPKIKVCLDIDVDNIKKLLTKYWY